MNAEQGAELVFWIFVTATLAVAAAGTVALAIELQRIKKWRNNEEQD